MVNNTIGGLNPAAAAAAAVLAAEYTRVSQVSFTFIFNFKRIFLI